MRNANRAILAAAAALAFAVPPRLARAQEEPEAPEDAEGAPARPGKKNLVKPIKRGPSVRERFGLPPGRQLGQPGQPAQPFQPPPPASSTPPPGPRASIVPNRNTTAASRVVAPPQTRPEEG